MGSVYNIQIKKLYLSQYKWISDICGNQHEVG